MQSFCTDEYRLSIVVVGDDNRPNTLMLPVAGDPSSLGDHVPADLREAAQTPQSPEAWAAYLAALPQPVPVVLTPTEKLANAGLTVDELKGLLGLA